MLKMSLRSPLRRRKEDKAAVTGGSSIAALALKLLTKQNKKSQISPEASEAEILEELCRTFQGERSFSTHQHGHRFAELLQQVKVQRSTASWLLAVETGAVPHDHTHSVLMTLRLLLRDESFQQMFMNEPSPIPALTQCLALHTHEYFSANQELSTTDILKELTNIFQKLSNPPLHRVALVQEGCHNLLVQLLSARDIMVLQCSLCALINICKSPAACNIVCKLSAVTVLVPIMGYPTPGSRQLASDLFLLLSYHPATHQLIKDTDMLPACLKHLHSSDMHVLHRMVGSLERLTEDRDIQELIRMLGGIPLLLSILSKISPAGDQGASLEKILALKAVCCSAVTQLVMNDTNAQSIVQSNGIYLLSSLILPVEGRGDVRIKDNLQRNALRALRYLFSLERNRQQFRRLFPPELFAAFIDIGHYVHDLGAYTVLIHMINTLPESDIAMIRINIEATNQLKSPIFSVGGYTVLDLLGSGSFGSVYKVKKKNSDTFLAMKEIRASHPQLGTSLEERGQSLGRVLNEVTIIKEQLHHPNVVHYHKCFQEGGHLYIVMELLEGAPLSEYFSSMLEKRQSFSEQRIWRIFSQLVLALRYIHKEKHIVHRDLSPANVMLGEGDKLTITDFGLAKLKQREFSVMKSVVGTMLYWCPQLVQNEPYTERADIWAAGCILYQMATLKPPFYSTNLLALAKKIVEVDYESISTNTYSPLVSSVVNKCLCADPTRRPDSVELGSLIAGVLMAQMDQLSLQNEAMEKRLLKERQRTIRHMNRSVQYEQQYRQLLTASENTSRDVGSSARRKLSAGFAASLPDMASLPGSHCLYPLGHCDSLATSIDSLELVTEEGPQSVLTWRRECQASTSEQRGRESSVEAEERDTAEAYAASDTDPLQKSRDSSVFGDGETHQLQYIYTNPGGYIPEQPLPADATPPMPPKQNPLISRDSSDGTQFRGRSHSAIVTSNGSGLDATSLKLGHRVAWSGSPQSRSQSAFVGAMGRGSPSTGPLSPLTHKSRTASASSVLSISPRHVREISDPITQLMTQLHKLLFLDQLPPSPSLCIRRILVDRYKRTLFDGTLPPGELKSEIHRLMSGGSETVQVVSGSAETSGLQPCIVEKALQELAGLSHPQELMNSFKGNTDKHTITYEQMQAILESLLSENGYYQRHKLGT